MPSKSTSDQALMPATNNVLNAAALLFSVLPKNLLSYSTGWVARLRLPPPLSTLLCRAFAAAFRLNMAEAEKPLADYATIEEVFTRALRPGLRPVASPVASPADGFLARSEPAEPKGQAVQAKGLSYDLGALVLGDGESNGRLGLAWYQTIYLAPHNYHRVHAPFAGRITAVRYLPGQLWPVNLAFTLRIPQLYTRNERLVFDFELTGGGRAYVVMVGALNVGRMVSPLVPDLITNSLPRQLGMRPQVQALQPPKAVAAGEEIGTFMLGSTVIIAYDRQALERFQLVQTTAVRPILMGQSLCVQKDGRT